MIRCPHLVVDVGEEESPYSYLLERITTKTPVRVSMRQEKYFSPGPLALWLLLFMPLCTGRFAHLAFVLGFLCYSGGSVPSPGGLQAVRCSCSQTSGYLQPSLPFIEAGGSCSDQRQSGSLRGV